MGNVCRTKPAMGSAWLAPIRRRSRAAPAPEDCGWGRAVFPFSPEPGGVRCLMWNRVHCLSQRLWVSAHRVCRVVLPTRLRRTPCPEGTGCSQLALGRACAPPCQRTEDCAVGNRCEMGACVGPPQGIDGGTPSDGGLPTPRERLRLLNPDRTLLCFGRCCCRAFSYSCFRHSGATRAG